MAKNDDGTTTSRPRRSAAEKAQAELDKAQQRLTKAEKRSTKAAEEAEAAARELALAQREVEYRAAHPDLADSGDVAAQMTHNDGEPVEG